MPHVSEIKNIVEVRGIGYSYGKEQVLTDITFDIHEGDYLGVVGPNGSGKTTLLKIMLGLVKPSAGQVLLFGQDVTEFRDWTRIGYVPQKVTNFDANFPATVHEVVLMGRYARRGLFKGVTKEDHQNALRALDQVGMREYHSRLIGDLSGGQQQRVFIARALAGKPEIIFLDEPTTGIDERAQAEFYALLKKLNEKLGLTLVLVSHDIAMVTKEVMHIACIDRTLVCHMTPQDFIKESTADSIFGQDVKLITHHRHNH
jgi:zinc transport system ATP-binding protein